MDITAQSACYDLEANLRRQAVSTQYHALTVNLWPVSAEVSKGGADLSLRGGKSGEV